MVDENQVSIQCQVILAEKRSRCYVAALSSCPVWTVRKMVVISSNGDLGQVVGRFEKAGGNVSIFIIRLVSGSAHGRPL